LEQLQFIHILVPFIAHVFALCSDANYLRGNNQKLLLMLLLRVSCLDGLEVENQVVHLIEGIRKSLSYFDKFLSELKHYSLCIFYGLDVLFVVATFEVDVEELTDLGFEQ